MSRKARNTILSDSCYAHVFSKSIENKYIFSSQRDFLVFKKYLYQYKAKYNFLLHHYCLMNTHFHFLVYIPAVQSFSNALGKLKWRYTNYYNHVHKRSGPLWRERFKSQLIADERYLSVCANYIETNPIRAGMVSAASSWPHSSSRYYENNQLDKLVDGYDYSCKPVPIDNVNEHIFQRGNVIGPRIIHRRRKSKR